MAEHPDWPHAPIHRLSERGAYIVTAATLHKLHRFDTPAKLSLLHDSLLRLAAKYGWQLEAWAVFSNHYHFVAQSPPEAGSLKIFLKDLHSLTLRELNKLDATPARKVWHNFRDTHLTFEKSYMARLNYVHQNPVRHGLVPVANQYHWCSAAWFERVATPAMIKTIYSFKTDQIAVPDDFGPL
jgi:REP-associated tyrosine transposase